MAVLLFEVNLPISLMLAWLNNPLTLAPILYIGFWFGAHIYHVHMINKKMLRVLHQISRWITHFGHGHIDLSLAKILISGLIVEAFVFATILYIVTEVFGVGWSFETGKIEQDIKTRRCSIRIHLLA